jgi:hypothetical protein
MTAPSRYIKLRNRMLRLCRTRVLEALQNARLARASGDVDGVRSRLVAMRFWRRAAKRWARKTVL